MSSNAGGQIHAGARGALLLQADTLVPSFSSVRFPYGLSALDGLTARQPRYLACNLGTLLCDFIEELFFFACKFSFIYLIYCLAYGCVVDSFLDVINFSLRLAGKSFRVTSVGSL